MSFDRLKGIEKNIYCVVSKKEESVLLFAAFNKIVRKLEDNTVHVSSSKKLFIIPGKLRLQILVKPSMEDFEEKFFDLIVDFGGLSKKVAEELMPFRTKRHGEIIKI